MFDLRPSKLALRKSFERRIWQNKESFSDYFHDKVILANRVPVDDEELTDYIIDGIPDKRLRDQARIQRFNSKSDLLEAFRNLTLDFKSLQDKNDKYDKNNKSKFTKDSTEAKTEGTTVQTAARTCYHCKETGHISRNCKQQQKKKTTENTEGVTQSAQNSTKKK